MGTDLAVYGCVWDPRGWEVASHETGVTDERWRWNEDTHHRVGKEGTGFHLCAACKFWNWTNCMAATR